MATLIASSRDFQHIQVLTYTAESVDQAVNKFIDRIFAAKSKTASNRLVIKDGRYMYTPSDEYNKIDAKLIRYKNYKR